MKRRTIAKEIEYIGVGLHKGKNIKMRLLPGEDGIIFRRVDLEEDKNEISLDIINTFDLTRGTNLQNETGAKVYTIEHFLSALAAAQITDLIVELDGNELPICDGSARVFLELFEEAKIKELDKEIEPIVVKKPVYLTVGDKNIVALPYDGYKITYAIRFEHTFLKSQLAEFEIDMKTYKKK